MNKIPRVLVSGIAAVGLVGGTIEARPKPDFLNPAKIETCARHLGNKAIGDQTEIPGDCIPFSKAFAYEETTTSKYVPNDGGLYKNNVMGKTSTANIKTRYSYPSGAELRQQALNAASDREDTDKVLVPVLGFSAFLLSYLVLTGGTRLFRASQQERSRS
jgi:hypothetical protein